MHGGGTGLVKRRLFMPAVRAGTGGLAEPGGLRGRDGYGSYFIQKNAP